MPRAAKPTKVTLSVKLHVTDLPRSLAFYERLGLAVEERLVDGLDRLFYASGTLGGATLEFAVVDYDWDEENVRWLATRPLGAGVVVTLNVADADRVYALVQKLGARVEEPIGNRFWGERTFTFEDPDGYVLTVAAPQRRLRAAKKRAPAAPRRKRARR